MGRDGQAFERKFTGGRAYNSKWVGIPDAVLVVAAQKYTTRNQWRMRDSPSYQEVLKHRRHLIEACTAHMIREGDPFKKGYQVYVYEFADRVVYVGLTCTPKRRHKDHKQRGRVAAKLKAGIAVEFKIVGSGLMPTPAGQLETETIEKYKAGGWTVLNRHRGGSTGQIRTKYTYPRILEIARACDTKRKFLADRGGAFQAAMRRKWMRRLEADLGWPRHADHWTFEECLQSAKGRRYVVEWLEADRDAYLSAWRNGWLPKIKKLAGLRRKPPLPSKWTKETCLKRARNFKRRFDWEYRSGDGSYKVASQNGWLKEIAALVFGPRRNRWYPV